MGVHFHTLCSTIIHLFLYWLQMAVSFLSVDSIPLSIRESSKKNVYLLKSKILKMCFIYYLLKWKLLIISVCLCSIFLTSSHEIQTLFHPWKPSYGKILMFWLVIQRLSKGFWENQEHTFKNVLIVSL